MSRVLTAAVLIPAIFYAIFSDHLWLFLAVVVTVGFFCYYEYCGIVAGHGITAGGPLGYGAGLLVLLAPGDQFAAVTAIGLVALTLAARGETLKNALPGAAALLMGVVYIFGTLRCGVALRSLNPHWLFFAVMLNWTGDIAAYYFGRMAGRHKLAPRISPSKTWEGAAASLAFSVAAGTVYIRQFLPGVSMVEAALLTGVANIAGQIGDLSESAIKRGAGVKDSGGMLPGHGGWLDRVDSSLFSFPVVYLWLSRPWKIWL